MNHFTDLPFELDSDLHPAGRRNSVGLRGGSESGGTAALPSSTMVTVKSVEDLEVGVSTILGRSRWAGVGCVGGR